MNILNNDWLIKVSFSFQTRASNCKSGCLCRV